MPEKISLLSSLAEVCNMMHYVIFLISDTWELYIFYEADVHCIYF